MLTRVIRAYLLKKAAIGSPEDYATAVGEQSTLLKELRDRKVSLGFRVEVSLMEKDDLLTQRVLKFRDVDDFVKQIKDDEAEYRREFGKVGIVAVDDYTLEFRGEDFVVRYRLLDTSERLSELGLGSVKSKSTDVVAPKVGKDLVVKIKSTSSRRPRSLVETKVFASQQDILNKIRDDQLYLKSNYANVDTHVINGGLIVLSFGKNNEIEYQLQDKAAFGAQSLSYVKRFLGG